MIDQKWPNHGHDLQLVSQTTASSLGPWLQALKVDPQSQTTDPIDGAWTRPRSVVWPMGIRLLPYLLLDCGKNVGTQLLFNSKEYGNYLISLHMQVKGQYQILRRVGKVSYELDLPNELALVHPSFHVSMIKKFVGEPTSIIPLEGLGVDECLSYEEVPVEILDQQVKRLRNKEISSVKVL
ncbi:hypothetical protein MTR67_006917 [Solanum verrucosum]|uniref:Tf2-1-like SH3-like domain-containing protein n=1 Tax=Solanum verrucosum TaxID=315347 RepID=A0AAF0PZ62_SOLVR|nr:hypothetical protein MTR67_006917 [Solanum verrucosum]